jgi:hypothetical protein
MTSLFFMQNKYVLLPSIAILQTQQIPTVTEAFVLLTNINTRFCFDNRMLQRPIQYEIIITNTINDWMLRLLFQIERISQRVFIAIKELHDQNCRCEKATVPFFTENT